MYVKDPLKSKYQFLINGRKNVWIKKLKNPKTFIEYAQTIDDVYENLEDYNPMKKRKVLIVFDDTIADMKVNRKLNPIFTQLFLRGRKVNISLAFLIHSHFVCLKL